MEIPAVEATNKTRTGLKSQKCRQNIGCRDDEEDEDQFRRPMATTKYWPEMSMTITIVTITIC